MKSLSKFFDKDILSFLGHSRNYLGSDLFGNVLAIITIPIFTRLLSPSDYGIMSIFSSFISILTIMFSLGLKGAINVNYVHKKYPHNEYLATNLLFITCLNIFFLLIAFLLRNIIGNFFNIVPYIFILSVITAFFTIYSDFFLGTLQIRQKSVQYAFLNFLKNTSITLISLLVIFLMTKDLYFGRIYTILSVNFLFAIYSISKLLKQSIFNLKLVYIQDALGFSLPLIPHLLSGFVLTLFDSIIINQLKGSSVTGIYSIAYQFGLIFNMIIMSMNQAWQPICWQMLKDEAYIKINKLIHKYAKYVYVIALVMILFSKEAILILVDKSYFEAIAIAPVIIFSYVFVFLYTIFSGYAFYSKRTSLISLYTVIAATLNVILNYYYIPIYGYVAAAYTTLFSYFISFILHYINVKYILKFDKIKLKAVLPDFLFLIIILLFYYTLTFLALNIFILVLIKILLICITFYYYFKINNKSQI